MRALAAAIVLLVITSILIISNGLYISHFSNDILTLIENGSDIYIIEEKWKRSRDLLTLSTDHDKIFKIDSLLDSAILFCKESNKNGYEHTMTLIKGAISEIKNFEEFSLSNII